MCIPSDYMEVGRAVYFSWCGQVSQVLVREKPYWKQIFCINFHSQIVKCANCPTCSSFILTGRSSDLLAISSKLSSSPSRFLGDSENWPFTGLSVPALSPPRNRPCPSTSMQLLSAEAGRGLKSEAKESSGSSDGDSTAEVFRKEPAKSRPGLRITPALVLLGIHRAKKSAWEKWSPAGDDMLTALTQAAAP